MPVLESARDDPVETSIKSEKPEKRKGLLRYNMNIGQAALTRRSVVAEITTTTGGVRVLYGADTKACGREVAPGSANQYFSVDSTRL